MVACTDVERGDRLVGHQQVGRSASARAIATRWRCPPENWRGYACTSSAVRPTARAARVQDSSTSLPGTTWCTRSSSWSIAAHGHPRVQRRVRILEDHLDAPAARGRAAGAPSRQADLTPVRACSPTRACASVDLPDPDSPTRASASPRWMSGPRGRRRQQVLLRAAIRATRPGSEREASPTESCDQHRPRQPATSASAAHGVMAGSRPAGRAALLEVQAGGGMPPVRPQRRRGAQSLLGEVAARVEPAAPGGRPGWAASRGSAPARPRVVDVGRGAHRPERVRMAGRRRPPRPALLDDLARRT